MRRPDEVVLELACGARVTVRVEVDAGRCREGDGRCPSPEEVAGMIWLSLQDEEQPAPTVRDLDCDSDCDSEAQ